MINISVLQCHIICIFMDERNWGKHLNSDASYPFMRYKSM